MTKINASRTFKRDLFEIENARNLTTDELVETFVPTSNFWRMLSAKNNIVLGSRGSGKTALAKMISHSHLSRLNNRQARKMVSTKSFIGMYVPTKTQWIGSLKNKKWITEDEVELLFQWKLNIATCHAFLTTLNSCLITYYQNIEQRIKLERDVINEISSSWLDTENSNIKSIKQLNQYLDNLSTKKQFDIARARALNRPIDNSTGVEFYIELFEPLKRAIKIASNRLNIPENASWLLCIDEAENLPIEYHRILNSHLRAHSGNLFFKITTMPYCHYTLETNLVQPLNVGDDFDYVYIDQDENLILTDGGTKERISLVDNIFKKRALASGNKYDKLTLDLLLGPSILLDYREWNMDVDSEDMRLFKKYSSDITLKRADEVLVQENGAMQFKSQFGRKMKGLLILKNAISSNRGKSNLEVYSGAKLVIKCGDGNPRRLIRIFNVFVRSVRWKDIDFATATSPIINKSEQTKILISFSKNQLARHKSDAKYGDNLYALINDIGKYMESYIHSQKLGTEQVSSVKITEDIPDFLWELVKRAVALGLLFHNVNKSNPDQMPYKEGVFRMAYILTPNFNLLPRRGSNRDLISILARQGNKQGKLF